MDNDRIRTTSLVDLECLSFVVEYSDQHRYIMDRHGMVDHLFQLERRKWMLIKKTCFFIPGAAFPDPCGGIKAMIGVVSPDGYGSIGGCGTGAG